MQESDDADGGAVMQLRKLVSIYAEKNSMDPVSTVHTTTQMVTRVRVFQEVLCSAHFES